MHFFYSKIVQFVYLLTVCILCDHCSYGVLSFGGFVLSYVHMPTSQHSSNRHGTMHIDTLCPHALLNTPTATDPTTSLSPIGRNVYLDFKGMGRSVIQSMLFATAQHISVIIDLMLLR